MSDDVLLAGHTFGASPQSPASHAPTFFAAQLRFLDEWKVSALRLCVVCSCTLFMTDPVVLNASTHQSMVF